MSLTRKGNKLVANAEPKWNEAAEGPQYIDRRSALDRVAHPIADTTRLVRVRPRRRNWWHSSIRPEAPGFADDFARTDG